MNKRGQTIQFNQTGRQHRPRRRAHHFGLRRPGKPKNHGRLPVAPGETVRTKAAVATEVSDDPQSICGAHSHTGHSRPSHLRARKPFLSRRRPQLAAMSEDNNVAFAHVQPHYYRVRQGELCHQLG